MTTRDGHNGESLDLKHTEGSAGSAAPEASGPPPASRRFRLKETGSQTRDVPGGDELGVRTRPAHRAGYDPGDRLHRDLSPGLHAMSYEPFVGGWTETRLGRIVRFLFTVLLIGGAILGGVHVWRQGPMAVFFVILILALVYGVIRAGLEMGEASPFRISGHYFADFLTWWP